MINRTSILRRYLRVLCLWLLAFALAGSFGAGDGWDDTSRATLVERIDTPDRIASQGSRQAVLALAGYEVQGGDDPLSGAVALAALESAQGVRLALTSSNGALRDKRFYLRTPIRAPPFTV